MIMKEVILKRIFLKEVKVKGEKITYRKNSLEQVQKKPCLMKT